VRSVWIRNDLQTFARRRLKALEARLAQNQGMVLTEQQVRAMEKAKQEKEAHGEIETAHPGYLGAQDTYYVGDQEHRAHLRTDVHRHLFQGGVREALRSQGRAGGRRHVK
jgi:hypothetical protein